MSDKTIAVITGASSGIGRAIAVELCKHNVHCILAARSESGLQETAELIKESGGECIIIPTDVTQESSVNQLYEKSLTVGHTSIVVNNAGFGKFSKISDASIEDFDTQINTNLRGAFLLSKVFIPNMQTQKSGNLIFMNSIAGKQGYPYSAGYVASKYGLRGLAESLRAELREDNIKVISVHPGAIDTPFWDQVNANFPREEMLTAEMVAESVVHAIMAKGSAVVEELVLRRVGGDF